MRIAVAGTGYVGLSIAVLLSQHHEVLAVDVDPGKVSLLRAWKSPIRDRYIEKFLAEHEERNLHLTVAVSTEHVYADADYVIIAVPTSFDPEKNLFDTEQLENVIRMVLHTSDHAIAVIKSTVPVGFTARIREKYDTDRILFSPEFLRESSALYDMLYPSRIIVGCDAASREAAETFAGLLSEGTALKQPEVLYMGFTEAEAIKLFANTYLAMRVAYFNEVDTFAELNHLDTRSMIEGICLDPRIGNYYNAPSFGYGGYCLPKDTRQLQVDCQGIPEALIDGVVASNRKRKQHIAAQILKKAGLDASSGTWKDGHRPVIGFYRLNAKSNSDNLRSSAALDILEILRKQGADLRIYEPILQDSHDLNGIPVIRDVGQFCEVSDVIVANRMSQELEAVRHKVYTRDLFGRD